MTYKEETFLLNSLKELKERIRDTPDLDILAKEIHENNIMLKHIIKVINTWVTHHNQENDNDFDRNVLANFVSNVFNFNELIK